MARVKFFVMPTALHRLHAASPLQERTGKCLWLNRRRVVRTIMTQGPSNARCDGVHAWHLCAMRRGPCPVSCFYTPPDSVCCTSKDLCQSAAVTALRRSVRRTAIPKVGNFGSPLQEWTSATYCAGGPEADSTPAETQIRRQPSRRRQAADLRRDVLDQISARGRRRDHRETTRNA